MKSLIFPIFLIISLNSFGLYIQTCGLTFYENGSWSDYYFYEVNFLTGQELNERDGTYSFDRYSVYAYIELENDEYVFIKISNYTRCGLETTKECIFNKSYNLEGTDQFGNEWQICTRNTCI